MSKIVVDKVKLKSVANALRNRTGISDLMHFSEIPPAIESIPQSIKVYAQSSIYGISVIRQRAIEIGTIEHVHIQEEMRLKSRTLPLVQLGTIAYVLMEEGMNVSA
jgi:hypothetical protein